MSAVLPLQSEGERQIRELGMHSRLVCDTTGMSEDVWLEMRRHYVGASEVAALLGLSQYESAFTVWNNKINGSSFEGNIHTEFGNWMEPVILAEFPKRFLKETGIPIEAMGFPYMLQHPFHDCMTANLDGIMLHPELGVGVVEIKTASEFQRKEWQDETLPESYYAQIQQQLSVTGLNYAYVVALVGKRLQFTLINRNETIIEFTAAKILEFWNNHILTQEPPLPGGYESDGDILKAQYPSEQPGTIIQLRDLQDEYAEYKRLTAANKENDLAIEAFKQRLMQAMGDHEVAMIGDRKVTWKTVNRKGFTVEPKSFRMMRIN